jgi:hypothetical protein
MQPRPSLTLLLFFVSLAAVGATHDFRHGQPPQALRPALDYVPDLSKLAQPRSSELRELVERFTQDVRVLETFYSVPGSPLRRARLRELYLAWQTRLAAMPYDSLGVEGRIDWHLLQNHLCYELGLLDREEKLQSEMTPIIGFAEAIAGLQEARRQFEPLDPRSAAGTLAKIREDLATTRKTLEKAEKKPGKSVALRAAKQLDDFGNSLENWFKHYDGYDPEFGWWTREPYKTLTAATDDYAKYLREKIVGVKAGEDEPIVGDPIGAEGLKLDLEHEMIPYTPEELIAIADKEFAWCETEWRKVSQELGLGDDWKAALELAKQDHVAPGEQPAFIADQAYEAIDFLQKRDLLTIPPLAIDDWTMTMMSAERQKTSPFFLGGDRIIVSFPTDTMDHANKLASLRGNNRHFCHATVFHELIPGHHLQQWYGNRFNQHRRLFSTPFWVEGWALWWEFHLWDLGYEQTPLDKAGALFWRTHRCARIIFSLNFHLGKWTPEQCIDFLIDRVGHDRQTATGEVRRSFNGDYSPLYQVGYMMGAIQLRTLHSDFVDSSRMTEKAFHDHILKDGPMPIEMVRASLGEVKLPRDYRSSWKFVGEKP